MLWPLQRQKAKAAGLKARRYVKTF
jgi:hypothetical protein